MSRSRPRAAAVVAALALVLCPGLCPRVTQSAWATASPVPSPTETSTTSPPTTETPTPLPTTQSPTSPPTTETPPPATPSAQPSATSSTPSTERTGNNIYILKIESDNPSLADAEVVHPDGTAEEAFGGMKLGLKDRVRTGFGTRVFLALGREDTLDVGPESDILLEVLKVASPIDIEIWMVAGRVTAVVVQETGRANAFRVRAPTVTTSSRGTRFAVSYDRARGTSTVSVSRDSVEVQPTKPWNFSGTPVPNGASFTLNAPDQVQVGAHGVIGTPPAHHARSSATWLIAVGVAAALAVAAVVVLLVRRARRRRGPPRPDPET